MSTIIKVRCIDQTLILENTPSIASGALEVDRVEFAFCSKWDSMTKTAVFWKNEDDAYHCVLDANGGCAIPHEVLDADGVIYFGVFGVDKNGRQRPSNVLSYRVEKGAITEGTKPSDPTLEFYQQLLAAHAATSAEIAVERARISSIVKQMDESGGVAVVSNNKFDNIFDETGGINSNTGENEATERYERTSKYYDLGGSPGGDVYVAVSEPQGDFPFSVVLYGENKEYIDYISVPAGATMAKYNSPSSVTVKYFRVCVREDFSGKIYVSGINYESYEAIDYAYETAPVDMLEVADIRVGHDGTIYITAGEAVRAQMAAAMTNKTGHLGILYNQFGPVAAVDTAAQTFTIPAATRVVYGDKVYERAAISKVVLDISNPAMGYITYDTENNVFTTNAHSDLTIESNKIIIATYGAYNGVIRVNMPGSYTIDGYLYGVDTSADSALSTTSEKPVQNKVVTAKLDELEAKIPDNNSHFGLPEFALLNHYGTYPEWDTTAKTLTIPNNSRLITGSVVYVNGMNAGKIVLDLIYERGIVCYNIETGAFTVYSHDPAGWTLPASSVLIATYASYGAIVNMASAYKINGDLYGVSASGTKANAYTLLVSQSGITLRFDTIQKQVKIYANNIVGSSKNKLLPSALVTLNNIYANGTIVYDYTSGTYLVQGHGAAVGDNQILIAAYANYGLKGVSTACSYSIDGYLYGINTDKITAPRKITSPDYERIQLPTGTPMWSDLFTIGDNFIGMVQSGDEEHTAKDGKVLIYDTNFNLQKTLHHDFGHCNTCHYNANTDTLLIGNLPGNTAYPGALYIFYNASSWLEMAEGTVLEFNALNPTIINLADLGTLYNVGTIVQVAACWGDCNAGENNIVYVNSMYNSRWFKIVLGKGGNQYTYGAYTAQEDASKFNGTYNAVEFYTCNKKYMPSEVTQGIEYHDGQIITAEGHNGARVLKWSLDTVNPYAYGKEMENVPFDYANAATYETRLNYVYNPDGTILKVATEGIVIRDGYMYVGVFFYDEGNGSKPANSVFENSVFKYKI